MHDESPPLCVLARGEIFVVDIAALFDFAVGRYEGAPSEWVPVRCGDRAAVVRRTDTLLDATIVDGPEPRLFQVMNVECDVHTFFTWAYGASGRAGEGTRVAGTVVDPCGNQE